MACIVWRVLEVVLGASGHDLLVTCSQGVSLRQSVVFSLVVLTCMFSSPAVASRGAPPFQPAQIEEEDEDEKDEDKSFDIELSPSGVNGQIPSSANASSKATNRLRSGEGGSKTPGVKAPWAGSSMHWSNVARLMSLNKEALLTYNPYAAMNFSVRPRYRWKWINIAGDLSFSTQLTRADDGLTSSFSDPSVTFSPRTGYEIPGTGLQVSGSARMALGLSPYSRAAGQSFSATTRGSLSRGFLVKGIKGGVNLGVGWTGYQTSTQQGTTARAVGPACVQGVSAFVEIPDDCAGFFVHDGSPNNRYKMSLSLGGHVKPLPWLSLSLGGGLSATEVYAMVVDDPAISYRRVADPVTTRYFQAFSVGAAFGPWQGFGASLSYSTAGPQLGPDGEAYALGYNRFSLLSLGFSYQL